MKTQTFSRSSIVILIFALLLTYKVNAQYNSAIGIRVGGTTGIDGKFFTKQAKAVEVLAGWFGNGSSLTVLIEKYSAVENARGLYVYYGGGPHLAYYNGKSSYYSYFGREITYHQNNSLGIGINGVVGFEYRMPDGIPISFSVDIKPFIELGTGGYIGFALDPSFGVKFILH